MSACIKQVLASYDDGMTPDEIAEQEDLEVTAIKAILMQSSTRYRQDCKLEQKLDPERADLNFNEDQLKRVNAVIYDVALSARLPDGTPDFRTQLRAAQYIRDDVKGRLTPVRNINQVNTFNLLEFNGKLEQARLGATAARRSIASQTSASVVDIETMPA